MTPEIVMLATINKMKFIKRQLITFGRSDIEVGKSKVQSTNTTYSYAFGLIVCVVSILRHLSTFASPDEGIYRTAVPATRSIGMKTLVSCPFMVEAAPVI
jgi:hypothetical protein